MNKHQNNLIGKRLGEAARVILRKQWDNMSHSDRKWLVSSLGGSESDEEETCNGEPKPTTPCDEGYEWACGVNGWFQHEIG